MKKFFSDVANVFDWIASNLPIFLSMMFTMLLVVPIVLLIAIPVGILVGLLYAISIIAVLIWYSCHKIGKWALTKFGKQV